MKSHFALPTMKCPNLYVIILGSIFLSILSEIVAQPVAQGMPTPDENQTVTEPEISVTTDEQNSPSLDVTVKSEEEDTNSLEPRILANESSTDLSTELTLKLPKTWKKLFIFPAKTPLKQSFGNRQENAIFPKTHLVGRPPVASNPVIKHKPGGKLSTACMGSTIHYVKYKTHWVLRHVYKQTYSSMTVYMSLRREIRSLPRHG